SGLSHGPTQAAVRKATVAAGVAVEAVAVAVTTVATGSDIAEERAAGEREGCAFGINCAAHARSAASGTTVAARTTVFASAAANRVVHQNAIGREEHGRAAEV